jgi:hypothetical protein
MHKQQTCVNVGVQEQGLLLSNADSISCGTCSFLCHALSRDVLCAMCTAGSRLLHARILHVYLNPGQCALNGVVIENKVHRNVIARTYQAQLTHDDDSPPPTHIALLHHPAAALHPHLAYKHTPLC